MAKVAKTKEASDSQLFAVLDSGAGEGGSEVVSVDDGVAVSTNAALSQIDVWDIASRELIRSIDISSLPDYGGVNSVAIKDGQIAVAIQNADGSQTGFVARYTLEGDLIGAIIEVGILPDMLTYSKDGTKIFVANEGEPDGSGPTAGSISIIDVATGDVETYGFEGLDAMKDALIAAGVRIFPDSLPSEDFEPEYIAEDPSGQYLYVTLQEANAVAVFDLQAKEFTTILPLGAKDHSIEGAGLDVNDKGGEIDITTADVFGLRMPDAIAAFETGGETYFMTANEGDDRGEAERVSDLLDDGLIDPALAAKLDDWAAAGLDLSRLNVSTIDGDTDGDGDIDELYAYGGRSFTIYDTEGDLVFDSGDDFEQIIATVRPPNAFNNDAYPNGEPDEVLDNRSDNKGPEPEAIAFGEIDGRTYAFIGLERDGGIMVYDVTDPTVSTFVDYIDARSDGNISPEVIRFIPASESVTGSAQIAVSFEVSGTTAIYDIPIGQTIQGGNGGETLLGGIGDDVIGGGGKADALHGFGGDDQLLGGAGNDRLYGWVGDDELNGGAGNDMLSGGEGDDTLVGGAGDDILSGGEGDDTLSGGVGADRYVLGLDEGVDSILTFDKFDRIDLSDEGLEFNDIEVTYGPGNRAQIEVGGELIAEVQLTGVNALTADYFLL